MQTQPSIATVTNFGNPSDFATYEFSDVPTDVSSDSAGSAVRGLPDVGVGAPFRCTSALEAMQKAGADSLDPADAAVRRTLTACHDVAEWVGGVYAVPGSIGDYSSAGAISNSDLIDTLVTVCAANPRTPTCKDAATRGLLD